MHSSFLNCDSDADADASPVTPVERSALARVQGGLRLYDNEVTGRWKLISDPRHGTLHMVTPGGM